MKKITPICLNKDFKRIYTRGKSFVTPLFVVYIFKNRLRETRIGITTSKKIGNAVKRNRSRRILREAYRQLSEGIKPGFDIVIVARGKTPYVKSTDIFPLLKKQFVSAGILAEETAVKLSQGGVAG